MKDNLNPKEVESKVMNERYQPTGNLELQW